MIYLLKDRVKDILTGTGTGNLTAAGTPPATYEGLDTALGHSPGDGSVLTPLFISDGANWEISLCYLSDATTVHRQTCLRSSNGNAFVSFPSGSKSVFGDLPAKYLVALDGAATPSDGDVLTFDSSTGLYTPADGGIRIGSAGLDATDSSPQAILAAVPTGKKRLVVGATVREPTGDLSTMGDDFGLGWVSFGDSGMIFGFASNPPYWGVLSGKSLFATATSGFGRPGAAGEILYGIFGDPESSTGTVTVDVLYYDIDA